jgi:LmbE family N-acetylglucosaminyl deacetylase
MAETIEPSNPAQTDTPTEQAPRRVLIVMAHPDDGEFGCGGTVAKWAAEGRDVWYCLVTDGQVGDAGDNEITSEALAAKRHIEAQNAADALGVQHPVIFLHYWDSRLEPTLEVRRDIARVIRQVKPDVVICQDPTVRWNGQGYINHPDHRAAGEATLAAIMPVASTRLAFPELAAEGLATHNVREIYITGTQSADRWVDIGGYVEKKVEALRQHVSQLRGWDPQDEITRWAKEGGDAAHKHGHDFTYAEGFKYIRLEDD